MNESKFKEGDIAYWIDISQLNVVTIIRGIIKSAYFNDLPEYNKWIYDADTECIKRIRTYQLDSSQYIIDTRKHNDEDKIKSSIKEELNPNNCISSSGSEETFYSKNEITISLIKKLLEENKRKREEYKNRINNDYVHCYFTGKKLIQQSFDAHVMDGPTIHMVEGINIRYEKWPRSKDWICYYNGKKYLLKLNNNIFELIKEILPPTYEEILKSEENFKIFFKDNFGIDLVAVNPRSYLIEDVKVQPMSAPTTSLFYFEPYKEKKQIYKVLDGKIREIKIH